MIKQIIFNKDIKLMAKDNCFHSLQKKKKKSLGKIDRQFCFH
jgi:hypothetical protein